MNSLCEIPLKGIHFKLQKVFMKIKKPHMCWSWLQDSQRLKASRTIGDEYLSTKDMNKLRATFKMLWRVFQLAFRVHNFAGGHDDKAEQLCCSVSKEMETYPSSFWLELVNK